MFYSENNFRNDVFQFSPLHFSHTWSDMHRSLHCPKMQVENTECWILLWNSPKSIVHRSFTRSIDAHIFKRHISNNGRQIDYFGIIFLKCFSAAMNYLKWTGRIDLHLLRDFWCLHITKSSIFPCSRSENTGENIFSHKILSKMGSGIFLRKICNIYFSIWKFWGKNICWLLISRWEKKSIFWFLRIVLGKCLSNPRTRSRNADIFLYHSSK